MKISPAVVVAAVFPLGAVVGIPATTDIYYHEQEQEYIGPALWVFGAAGIKAYSADGSTELKSISKDNICEESTDFHSGVSSNDCAFIDVASDGHKYVWTAVTQGSSRVDIFSIDTGDFVASLPTCDTPLDLDYIPNRQEMWLRCTEPNEEDGGHIDSWSVNALSSDFQQIRLVNETGSLRAYGRSAFHSSMGNYGFATASNEPVLFKVNLNSKTVEDTFPLVNSHGAYDMTYSKVNRHVYLRARVCCTCGAEGTDKGVDCGRGPPRPVNVLTGPNAGGVGVDGTCGDTCMGTPADTIGVYEFDTVSGQFVGSHNIKEGTGFGADPVASPDGKYVFLLGNDGGQNVRILQAGANGQKSTVAFDVPLGLDTLRPAAQGISDFAFVSENVVALASAFDNHLVLVDLGQNPPQTHKILLSNSAESTGGRSRSVEWAAGTNYLWVDGSAAEEHYVVEMSADGDISKARLVRTIQNFAGSHFLWVQNYEALRWQNRFGQATTDASEAMVGSDDDDDDDDNYVDPVGIAALVIATLAMALGVINTVFIGKGMPVALEEQTKKNTNMSGAVSLGSSKVPT